VFRWATPATKLRHHRSILWILLSVW
jgi:hypothetical protein